MPRRRPETLPIRGSEPVCGFVRPRPNSLRPYRRVARKRTRLAPHREMLLRFAEVRRAGEREKNDLFADFGADVMVHGHDRDASNLLDHCLHDGASRFEQLGSQPLEQIPSVFGRKRFDHLLFGRRQDPSKANQ